MNLPGLRVAAGEFLFAALSRLLATPMGWLLPRDPRLWVVLGREHGRYIDNAKYFHAWLHGNLPAGQRVVFVGERRDELSRVEAAGGHVAHYPGWRAFWLLLRAGTVVCDTADAIDHGRVGLMAGARRVQIWHGAPLKEIELPLHRRRLAALPAVLRPALRFQKFVLGRYAPWDFLVSTSDYFTRHAFSACLPARRIVASGYPRNDMLFGADGYPPALLRVNVDETGAARLAAHRAAGGRVVLYAPTFRADGGSPFAAHIDLAGLSDFARQRNLLFALKLHPVMAGRYAVDAYPGVVEIAAASDVYPLLPAVDVLVTDYSSIYFDFLLLDRPLVFYPYDLDRYVADERRLLFPYEQMTPGPKVATFGELLAAVGDAVAGSDGKWSGQRRRVRELAFDGRDGHASRRLAQALATPGVTP